MALVVGGTTQATILCVPSARRAREEVFSSCAVLLRPSASPLHSVTAWTSPYVASFYGSVAAQGSLHTVQRCVWMSHRVNVLTASGSGSQGCLQTPTVFRTVLEDEDLSGPVFQQC